MTFDPVTAGQAARGALRKGRKQRSPFGSVGQRIFGGRMGTLNVASATTFHVALEVPIAFDGVQIIFGNTDPRFSWPFTRLAACALPSAADLNGSSETWTAGMANGTGLGTLNQRNSPGVLRVGYTLSDVIPVASVARSDGGTNPIIAVRAYTGGGATFPVVGDGTDSFASWASRTDGHRYAMRHQVVSAATAGTNTSAFTSTTNQSQSPIVGVRIWSRGRVVNVMSVGDSIDDGRGTHLGAGYGEPLCDALTSANLTFMHSNLGWSGQSSTNFYPRALDAIRDPAIRPDILILPTMTPNDGDPLTAAQFAAARVWRSQIINECRRQSVVPVFRTMLPVSTAVHDWGSSDALRRADNAAALLLNDRDVFVVDTADIFEGAIDGDGQSAVLAGKLPDGIHPDTDDLAEMATAFQPAVSKAALR